jgi:hypothetical protein
VALGAVVALLLALGEGGCSAILGIPDIFFAEVADAADAADGADLVDGGDGSVDDGGGEAGPDDGALDASGGEGGDATVADGPADGPTGDGCGDINADPLNCGACNHSCLGGGCVGGRCTPAPIVLYDGSPGAITVQQGYVYWVDNFLNGPTGQATILRVPTDAPPTMRPMMPEKVATSAASTLTAFHAMAGGLLYFVQPYQDDPSAATAFMERLDLKTSTISRVVANVPFGQGISDDTQNLYWVDFTGTAFEVRSFDSRNPADAGSTIINHVDSHGPYVTVWAQGHLYWGEDACKLNTTTCPVVACAATPTANTCTTTMPVIPGTGDVTALVSNATVLFAGTARGGIYQYAFTPGATLTSIPGPAGSVENEPFVLNMAVDARGLYWVNRSDSTDVGAINGCPLTASGGVVAQCETPFVVMDNVKHPNGIALDDSAIYFGVESAGTIYRLAR